MQDKTITYKIFENHEAQKVSELLQKNFREVNSKDYSAERIIADCATHTPEYMIKRAQTSHFYVFYYQEQLVGCGAIAQFHGRVDESILLTIFVDPAYHGMKIGQQIIAVLENDIYFKTAKRIEIPASITAVEFYRKQGYDYKNNVKALDEEELYRLEKFN